jgi:hypothetical protein
MGEACFAELLRGRQLVVAGEERLWAVQQPNVSAALELLEALDPGLDTVERRAHVEPPDRRVSGAERLERLCGPKHTRIDAELAPSEGELDVRPRGAAEQGDCHASTLSQEHARAISEDSDLSTVCPPSRQPAQACVVSRTDRRKEPDALRRVRQHAWIKEGGDP